MCCCPLRPAVALAEMDIVEFLMVLIWSCHCTFICCMFYFSFQAYNYVIIINFLSYQLSFFILCPFSSYAHRIIGCFVIFQSTNNIFPSPSLSLIHLIYRWWCYQEDVPCLQIGYIHLCKTNPSGMYHVYFF